MNKADKRQRSIRNKLMAAVAMLLVASIMTVTTTYAWFTLSTAPEVQGITTTVGANGNLEIALSPLSGDADEIGSAMGNSLLGWALKNYTWGNLLSLTDENGNDIYGLEDIKLMPAQLNIGSLGTTPLKTPMYGADGRLTTLEANGVYGGHVATLEDGATTPTISETFAVGGGKGVRAIGTSSTMSEYEVTFQNNLSQMAINIQSTQDLANASLNANGASLAEMAIKHANAASPDKEEYKGYLPTLNNVVTTLQDANAQLEKAIKASILATAASNALATDNGDGTYNTTQAEEAYDTVVGLVTEDAELDDIMTTLGTIHADWVSSSNPIQKAYVVWDSIRDKLSESKESLDGLATAATVSWNHVSGVMDNLMNTTGIKVNDKGLSEFKSLVSLGTDDEPKAEDYSDNTAYEAAHAEWQTAYDFVGTLTSGVKLQLGTGSGVYAEFGSVVGDLHAKVEGVKITYGSIKNLPVNADIDTTTGTNAILVNYRVAVAGIGAMQSGNSNSQSLIDVNYGYAVDLFFRTNASGSNLLLQTEAAQRVYDDSSSTETLGNGSTMTFQSTVLTEQAVKGLMDAIRVVFIDTTSGDLFGIAKLDMTTSVVTPVEGEDYSTITAKLYLYDYTQDTTTGMLTFGEKKTDNTLCAMPTNTAQAVSALVYLDGDYVTNEEVAATAESMNGTLNLQFASDANLVPMENTALKNMAAGDEDEEEVTVNLTPTTVTIQTSETLTGDVAVTVTGYTSTTSTQTADTTVTLNGTTTSGTATVYTGTVAGQAVDYTVTAPSGYVATETAEGSNIWNITVDAAQG